jgi:sterol desaturase/sphingolipid hydroxylase (fatty acid hydroxylase superfamily)
MTYDAPALIRFVCFAAVLLGLALLEAWWPRRQRDRHRASRWPHNLALVTLDTVLLRVVQPAGVVGVALWVEARGIGLWHHLEAPAWLPFLSTLLLLDLAVYAQHVLFHRVPALWRLHRVHHADVDVDVTTGLRFHPIEMLVSLGIKGGVVALWGGGAWAVLVFEVLLNATSMFTHANLALPSRIDGLLRRVLVTPDMHRVHHSVHADECNSNFGFNLSWWDHWFGTYRAAPRGGHDAMVLGLQTHRSPSEQRLDRLLTQPFRTSDRDVEPQATRGDASSVAR